MQEGNLRTKLSDRRHRTQIEIHPVQHNRHKVCIDNELGNGFDSQVSA